jgi:hypothetical protein
LSLRKVSVMTKPAHSVWKALSETAAARSRDDAIGNAE